MRRVIFFLFLLHSVSPLHITVDGLRGTDSTHCLVAVVPCQSLEYVAENLPMTTNLTVEITSSFLTLHDRVPFIDINGLTLTGQGPETTTIRCNGTYSANGSGITFSNNCTSIHLRAFTMEGCGLFNQYSYLSYGHALLFHSCHNVTVSQITLNNNHHGLVIYNTGGSVSIKNCTISNNYIHQKYDNFSDLFGGGGMAIKYAQTSQASYAVKIKITDCHFISNFVKVEDDKNRGFGGGVHIHIISDNVKIFFINCQFVNNSAMSGGAMSVFINFNSSSNSIEVVNSIFSNNKVLAGGGAILFRVGEDISNSPTCNLLLFTNCHFNNNIASFGGAVSLHSIFADTKSFVDRENSIKFLSCNFTGNSAKWSAAVDANHDSRKSYLIFVTTLSFISCQFIGNQAGVDLPQVQQYKSNLYNAIVFSIYVPITFKWYNIFENNKGTPLYIVSCVVFLDQTTFNNNTGNHGGAILLADDAVLNVNTDSKVMFTNNKAVVGGAICFLSKLTNILYYRQTCFLVINKPVTFTFINNSATSGIGQDIFASTFQPCLPGGGNITTFFNNMGTFNFSVNTGPVRLEVDNNKTHITPYPGIPYSIKIRQLDEFNNDIVHLDIFPLSAKLINQHQQSVTINVDYLTTTNYAIVFRGQEGNNGTLLLETTQYNAALLINVTLHHCPPGYAFINNSCYCSHSTELYYYGVLHCVEGQNAVIVTGLWAGYLVDNYTFATADCIISLCSYPNSISNRYSEHYLPLNDSHLDEYVCAAYRTGTLCGSCITDYTTYYHSPNHTCGESIHCQYGRGLFWYAITEIIPVTGIFLVILVFNINLTSGAIYSFIFYAQIVNHSYVYQNFNDPLHYLLSAMKIIYGIFDLEILEVEHLSFCLFENATIMDLFLMKYLTTIYALFLVFVTVLIMRFDSLYSCIKLCHKCGRRNIRGSIINGLTAFLILSYFHCLVITLSILVPSHIKGLGDKTLRTVLLYNGDLSYMSHAHLKYAIPAIICLAVIILPPPVLLLSEPFLLRLSGLMNMRRNAVSHCLLKVNLKLKPFLDSFQGCFKDNCRCFAGLFFILSYANSFCSRFVLWPLRC